MKTTRPARLCKSCDGFTLRRPSSFRSNKQPYCTKLMAGIPGNDFRAVTCIFFVDAISPEIPFSDPDGILSPDMPVELL